MVKIHPVILTCEKGAEVAPVNCFNNLSKSPRFPLGLNRSVAHIFQNIWLCFSWDSFNLFPLVQPLLWVLFLYLKYLNSLEMCCFYLSHHYSLQRVFCLKFHLSWFSASLFSDASRYFVIASIHLYNWLFFLFGLSRKWNDWISQTEISLQNIFHFKGIYLYL